MNSTHPASTPDLSGMNTVITGANSGIGLRTAVSLARAGARVTLACRDAARGAQALDAVRAESGSAAVELRLLDLADLASVRAFSAEWSGPLHLLINNAGVMATPRKLTVDGFEQQLGINHLGHFALTGLLLPWLRKAPAARVVTVSSLAHKRGRIDFDDLQSARTYRRWRAYNQSKLANLYFTVELDRRAKAGGDPLVAVAAHPGFSRTNLTAGMGHPAVLDLVGGLLKLMSQSDDAGALPIVHAATAPGVHGGDYYGPDGPGETRGNPTLVAPAPAVLDRGIARRLWDISAELTGVRYEGLAPAS